MTKYKNVSQIIESIIQAGSVAAGLAAGGWVYRMLNSKDRSKEMDGEEKSRINNNSNDNYHISK